MSAQAPVELPIVTERLKLRRYREADLDAIFDLQARDDVRRFIPWHKRTRDDCRSWLAGKISSTITGNDGDSLPLAIEETSTGTVIGEVLVIVASAKHSQGEIGYVLHPDYTGLGYATEAAAALVASAFDVFGFHRIQARMDARNVGSAAVARRLGMRHEAHLVQNEYNNGEWEDEVIYAILRREWDAKSAGPLE